MSQCGCSFYLFCLKPSGLSIAWVPCSLIILVIWRRNRIYVFQNPLQLVFILWIIICTHEKSNTAPFISLAYLNFVHTFFFFEIYFWERERARQRERGGERIPSSTAQRLSRGLISWNLRSWPEPKSRVGRLTTEPPGPPHSFFRYWL